MVNASYAPMRMAKAEFLSWVSQHYGDDYSRDCEPFLREQQPGEAVLDPDSILDEVLVKHQPEIRYHGKKFGTMRTSSH